MKPWVKLGQAAIPGTSDSLVLWQREQEFSLRISGYISELMNSRQHGSEEALAELTCPLVATRPAPQVLVGGLGMGFTLAAALRSLPAQARVTVAELVPEVVDWNREALGEVAGRPLDDPRTLVHLGDVGALIRQARGQYDAILLDVDNSPEGMTHAGNDWLYSRGGLAAIKTALRPSGVLGVWSVEDVPAFTNRLRKAGFEVQVHSVRARGDKGARHTVWVASRN